MFIYGPRGNRFIEHYLRYSVLQFVLSFVSFKEDSQTIDYSGVGWEGSNGMWRTKWSMEWGEHLIRGQVTVIYHKRAWRQSSLAWLQPWSWEDDVKVLRNRDLARAVHVPRIYSGWPHTISSQEQRDEMKEQHPLSRIMHARKFSSRSSIPWKQKNHKNTLTS